MPSLSRVLADVFDRRVDRPRLDEIQEQAAIRAVVAGDSDALVELVYAYAPALRSLVLRDHGRAHTAAPDDVRQAAVTGLVEACHAFDYTQHRRLAATLPGAVLSALHRENLDVSGFSVPSRTLRRFYGILRKADGDPQAAADLAPEFGMARETFWAVLASVRWVRSIDTEDHIGVVGQGEHSQDVRAAEHYVWANQEGSSLWADDFTDSSDPELVDRAFDAIERDALATDVVRLSYGFADYEPQTDGEVAESLGLSRSKTQRIRSGAIDTMRDALAIA